jgi:hypothetical protein
VKTSPIIVNLIETYLFFVRIFYIARPIFGYFRGTIHSDVRYSLNVRQRFHQLDSTSSTFINTSNRYEILLGHAPSIYWIELAHSLFALCPGGWAPWSPRLYDALIMGTIPVILADSLLLPYQTHVPKELVQDEYAITLPQNTSMKEIDSILTVISKDTSRLYRLWKNGEVVSNRFVFHRPSIPGDAFDYFIEELKIRLGMF